MNENILWIIVSPKQKIIINFKVSRIFKWVITKLMKKRIITIELIAKNKLKGYTASTVYLDEFKNYK